MSDLETFKNELASVVEVAREQAAEIYLSKISYYSSIGDILKHAGEAFDHINKARARVDTRGVFVAIDKQSFDYDVWAIAEQLEKKRCPALEKMTTEQLARRIGDAIGSHVSREKRKNLIYRINELKRELVSKKARLGDEKALALEAIMRETSVEHIRQLITEHLEARGEELAKVLAELASMSADPADLEEENKAHGW